jgi:hypothetical protein
MDRMIGILQLLLSGVLGTMALATLFNMALIAMRPETVSVASAAMGQLVVVIFLAVWSRVFFVKGQERVRSSKS